MDHLLAAVRTGSSGHDSAWFHKEVAATGRGASYDALMTAHVQANASDSRRPSTGQAWSTLWTSGVAPESCCDTPRRTPALERTAFDLPQVTPGGVGERGSFVAGSYFTDPLPAADAYVACMIRALPRPGDEGADVAC